MCIIDIKCVYLTLLVMRVLVLPVIQIINIGNMFFKIEDIGGVTQIRIFNNRNGEYLCVIPEIGGMLNGLGL